MYYIYCIYIYCILYIYVCIYILSIYIYILYYIILYYIILYYIILYIYILELSHLWMIGSPRFVSTHRALDLALTSSTKRLRRSSPLRPRAESPETPQTAAADSGWQRLTGQHGEGRRFGVESVIQKWVESEIIIDYNRLIVTDYNRLYLDKNDWIV